MRKAAISVLSFMALSAFFVVRLLAQQINSVTLVVDSAHYSAVAPVSWSGAGALAKAIAAIPIGATAQINVPAGYSETLTAAIPINLGSTTSLTIQAAKGAILTAGASNIAMLQTASGVTNLHISGLTFDGAKASYSGTIGIKLVGTIRADIEDNVFQNFVGQGILAGTSADGITNGYIAHNLFRNEGNGTIAGSGEEGAEINNPNHVTFEDNSCINFKDDDCVHAFGTTVPPGGSSFLQILNNHASGVARVFVEIQLNDLGGILVSGNDADTFTYNASFGTGWCISVGLSGGETPGGIYTPSAYPGHGGLIDGNRCTNPSTAHAPTGIGVETLASYMVVSNNVLDACCATGIVNGGRYNLFEGNKEIDLPGDQYGNAVNTENQNYFVERATWRKNIIEEPQTAGFTMGAGDAAGTTYDGNVVIRTPGFWSGDSTRTTFCGFGIGLASTAPRYVNNEVILHPAISGGSGFAMQGAFCLSSNDPGIAFDKNTIWNQSGTAAGTAFWTNADYYAASVITSNTIIGVSSVTNGASKPASYGANTSLIAAQWLPHTPYLLGQAIVDSAGHVQVATTAGLSGNAAPTFNHSGGTTADGMGTLVWTDNGVIAPAVNVMVNPGWQSLIGPSGTVSCAPGSHNGGGTCSVSHGSDNPNKFTVTLLTGGSPTADGDVADISFTIGYFAGIPICLGSFGGSSPDDTTYRYVYYTGATVIGYPGAYVAVGGTALAPSTTYQFSLSCDYQP